jgi:hypothetical protein
MESPMQKFKPPPQEKPSWMLEEEWQDHQEEVRAFNKRVYRQSGGRLAESHYPVSPKNKS